MNAADAFFSVADTAGETARGRAAHPHIEGRSRPRSPCGIHHDPHGGGWWFVMDLTKVPAVLKEAAQWICWRVEHRDGEATKVPLDSVTGRYASVADPGTWHDFATALTQYQRVADVDGVGFVFHEDGPFTGMDLDDCRDPATGAVDGWAIGIMHRLQSYTERSPSGTGFHIIVRGAVPAGGNRRGDVEMYDQDRYFTVTGDRVPGIPAAVEERAAKLRAIHAEYITAAVDAATIREREHRGGVPLSDEELIAKAKHAANGAKFRRLWHGDTSGYPSHSEADLALCNLLAFWTGGNLQRMERLFNRSGLVRAKWRDRPDYRERTIQKAIRSCREFYESGDGDETASGDRSWGIR